MVKLPKMLPPLPPRLPSVLRRPPWKPEDAAELASSACGSGLSAQGGREWRPKELKAKPEEEWPQEWPVKLSKAPVRPPCFPKLCPRPPAVGLGLSPVGPMKRVQRPEPEVLTGTFS